MNVVLVTGIGGNVGQGVLKNLHALGLEFKIIGIDIEKITSGNHLCHASYQVPYAYDYNYIDQVLQICDWEKVQLIIPTTDFEVYYLSLNSSKLPTIIANPSDTAKIFLDKYLTHEQFNKSGIPFAESILPSDYNGQFESFIVKPRMGRGSRGIHINPSNPKSFSDENMVQLYHEGVEITSAFYITKAKKILGPITFARQLENGMTDRCWIVNEYNAEVKTIMSKMVNNLEVVGPINIQSIVSSNSIVPFEINGRYSGTNSIRSKFGFNDVMMGVEEYLLETTPTDPNVSKKGGAMRIFSDIIYPEISDLGQVKNTDDSFYYF